MEKRSCLGIIGLAVALPAAVEASVVSFQEASQGYAQYTSNGEYNGLFYGQGAASDPGNNVWNGFGRYNGPGSTAFYGPGRSNSNVNSTVPAGNPGQPYAFTNVSGSASGNTLFSPTNPGAAGTGNAYSDGTLSPVTFSVSTITAENGSAPLTQGSPGFLLGTADVVSGATVDTFTLENVPTGTYNLFLYGANYDGTRGASFTASSGTPLDDFTTTTNPNATAGSGPLTSFILGVDYVEFTGVTPSDGTISGTWSAVTNPNSGLSGEGDFNGLQLQSMTVPEPSTLALMAVMAVAVLGWRRLRRHLKAIGGRTVTS